MPEQLEAVYRTKWVIVSVFQDWWGVPRVLGLGQLEAAYRTKWVV